MITLSAPMHLRAAPPSSQPIIIVKRDWRIESSEPSQYDEVWWHWSASIKNSGADTFTGTIRYELLDKAKTVIGAGEKHISVPSGKTIFVTTRESSHAETLKAVMSTRVRIHYNDGTEFVTPNEKVSKAPRVQTEKRKPAAVATSDGSGIHISDAHSFGCTDRDEYTKIGTYAAQGDSEAFRNGLSLGVLNGTCTFLKKGEPVFVVDTAVFSAMVKVRRRGQMEGYWTSIEAVK
jgi:hypothetical protein